jgi:hypothetical protein
MHLVPHPIMKIVGNTSDFILRALLNKREENKSSTWSSS